MSSGFKQDVLRHFPDATCWAGTIRAGWVRGQALTKCRGWCDGYIVRFTHTWNPKRAEETLRFQAITAREAWRLAFMWILEQTQRPAAVR